MKKIFTLAFGIILFQSVAAQPLISDSSFGNNGKVFHNLSNSNPASAEVAVTQPDGKILVGGFVQSGQMSFHISRFLTNGNLDSSFGVNGKAIIREILASANAINIQADGKIIAAAYSYPDSGSYIVRLLASGSIDNSFNGNGRFLLKKSLHMLTVNGIAAQADGKIVVAGTSQDTSYITSMYVARINANGTSLDNSFNGTGSRTILIGNSSWVNDMVLQTDGKILLGGATSVSSADATITRLNTDGSTDLGFAINGYYSYIHAYFDEIRSIVLQADGKIVLGGFVNGYPLIARLTSTGDDDQNFGTLGSFFGANHNNKIKKVHIKTDGKIIASCEAEYTNPWYASVIQLNSSGNPDGSFDGDGIMYLQKPQNGYVYFSGSVLQNDGKLLVYADNQSKAFFTRINTNGSIDLSYGNNGKLELNIGASDEWINSIAIQPDGKILSLGYAGFGTGTEIVRYNVNGSVDATFGTSGKLKVNEWFNPNHLLVLPNGKILASGSWTDTSNGAYRHQPAVARYTSAGKPDSTFNSVGYVSTTNFNPYPYLSNYNNAFYKSILLSDGKIIAAGTMVTDTVSTSVSHLVVARIQSNGKLDSTYGTNGRIVINISPQNEEFSDIKVLPDGKLVILVQSYNTDSTSIPAIVKLKTDGSFDNSFNGTGYKHIDLHPTLKVDWLARLGVVGDKILAAGISYNDQYDTVYLASVKLKADGSFDSSYNTTGKVLMWAGDKQPGAAVYDSTGNLFFAGNQSAWNMFNTDTVFISSIRSNGTVDSTLSFSPDDKFSHIYSPAHFAITDMAVLSNGSLLLAGDGGEAEHDKDYAFAVYKRTPNVPVTICPDAGVSLNANLSGSSYQWQMNTGNGFINIPTGSNYSGINSNSLQLSNMPSSNYGVMYRCVVDGRSSSIYQLQFANSWTGNANTAWENAANWACGSIPDANTDVRITTGNIVINSNVTIRTLTLSPGVNLTVQPGFTLTVLK